MLLVEFRDRQMAIVAKTIQPVGKVCHFNAVVVFQPIQDQLHGTGKDKLENERQIPAII